MNRPLHLRIGTIADYMERALCEEKQRGRLIRREVEEIASRCLYDLDTSDRAHRVIEESARAIPPEGDGSPNG